MHLIQPVVPSPALELLLLFQELFLPLQDESGTIKKATGCISTGLNPHWVKVSNPIGTQPTRLQIYIWAKAQLTSSLAPEFPQTHMGRQSTA